MADEFRINRDYAEKYNKWREKEELQKLKDKYGDVEDPNVESSTSESEDEEAEGLTLEVEKGWLRALAALKSKDPKIYDKSVQFYQEPEDSESDSENESGDEVKDKKKKPMFLKDYERKFLLEKGGKESDDGSSDEENNEKGPGYYEEQEEIRKSFKTALESDSEDEVLTKRTKSKEEQEREEADYIEWLKGQKPDLETDKQVGIELNPLKNYWNDPNLEEGEKFLRDYILNKDYLDDDDGRIPTYDEIVGDHSDENFSEEEKELEKQETFEKKYNFRYEEPDPEFIKSYPRTIADSLRRKKEKRAEKRKLMKERKQKEREKKEAELKQLKNLKKKEIMDRVDMLKQISGKPDLGLSNEDIDGDFDPKQHDRLMQQVFDEDYYEGDEDDEKPVFPETEYDDVLQDENWDSWKGAEGSGVEEEGLHCEDEGFIMDADYDPNNPEPKQSGDGKRRKRKSKFAKVMETKKPVFQPGDKTFEEYLDEYYKLDYEDFVGEQQCRFKYRSTVPNEFGLSTEEVLSCQDKELNAWVSVKRMSQYRTEEEELWDKKIFNKKSRNVDKKVRLLPSLIKKDAEHGPVPPPSKKRRRKNRSPSNIHIDNTSQQILEPNAGKRRKSTLQADDDGGVPFLSAKQKNNLELSPSKQISVSGQTKKIAMTEPQASGSYKLDNQAGEGNTKETEKSHRGTKEKKQKVKNKKPKHLPPVISEERLKAYGINVKKFKYTGQMQKMQEHYSKK